MKRNWRNLLRAYKEKSLSSATTLQKPHFPSLLKDLMDSLKENQQNTLQAGFRKCGIFPTSVQPLLNTIDANASSTEAIEDSFKEFLDAKRAVVVESGVQKKRKKFDIPAGSSITAEEICNVKVKVEEVHEETRKVDKGLKRIKNSEGCTPKRRNNKKLAVQSGGITAIKDEENKENEPPKKMKKVTNRRNKVKPK